MADAAREWAQRLEKGGWPAIERLVAQRAPETLHFEAKSKERPEDPLLTPGDRQNLSKALSGFANSDGGVLVWGLDARPGSDRVDRIQDFAPIGDLEGFVASLEAEPVDSVTPPVDGLSFIPIEDPDAPGTGVVVCVIPASDGGPHMAIGKKLHRYYRRDAGDFRAMEHFEVADMFGRRPHPVIRPRMEWSISFAGPAARRRAELVVQHFVRNEGRGIAKLPALTAGRAMGPWGDVGGKPIGAFRSTGVAPLGARIRVVPSAEVVLYPGDELLALRDQFRLDDTPTGRPEAFLLDSTAHCAGGEPGSAVLEISADELDTRATESFRGLRPRGGSWGW